MRIIDKLATKIVEELNIKQDNTKELKNEIEKLVRERDALAVSVKDREKKIERVESRNKAIIDQWKESDKEIDRLKNNKKQIEARLKEQKELVKEIKSLNNEYSEKFVEMNKTLESISGSNTTKAIEQLLKVNNNQLKYIEILQVLASLKSDKTKVKDIFGHNMNVYIKGNFDNVTRASEVLGINRTTISEIANKKTAVSFDNLDILDSRMCDFFDCSVYDLFSKKMEGKK